MRAVVQRVSSASVSVDGEALSRIGVGLVVLAAVGRDDTDTDVKYIVEKTVHLRIFPDDEGRFDRSVLDVGGSLLVVSQFTLYGDVRRGRRPSFTGAAPPAEPRSASPPSWSASAPSAFPSRRGDSRR